MKLRIIAYLRQASQIPTVDYSLPPLKPAIVQNCNFSNSSQAKLPGKKEISAYRLTKQITQEML